MEGMHSNPLCYIGVTFFTYTVYLKTMSCKGLVLWEVRGEGNQPLKYVHRQKLKVQNRDVQEYYIHVYCKKLL